MASPWGRTQVNLADFKRIVTLNNSNTLRSNSALYCLAVDDEPLALSVLENYIQKLSQLKLVAKCEDLEEAFRILDNNKVDVIFLDLNLKTASGIELVKKIKAQPGSRYYFIITSAIFPGTFEAEKAFEGKDMVLVDCLTKPFSFDRFVEAVNKVFDRKS